MATTLTVTAQKHNKTLSIMVKRETLIRLAEVGLLFLSSNSNDAAVWEESVRKYEVQS